MYAQILSFVALPLVMLIVVAKLAPRMPALGWRAIDVIAAALLAALGGLVAFTAISNGGDPKAGALAVLSFAGGLTCAAVSLLYYWEHRNK